ncbi:Lipase [Porphyridium purpureum]|uniref:Lipase n=1 Tax=Porphyridium purpureum TaxID=35688 RepID=A0A5J4ZAX9_PORPP|nr:Lipase [Porphyridium purpureum]|eukprot:POR2644..scf295_1
MSQGHEMDGENASAAAAVRRWTHGDSGSAPVGDRESRELETLLDADEVDADEDEDDDVFAALRHAPSLPRPASAHENDWGTRSDLDFIGILSRRNRISAGQHSLQGESDGLRQLGRAHSANYSNSAARQERNRPIVQLSEQAPLIGSATQAIPMSEDGDSVVSATVVRTPKARFEIMKAWELDTLLLVFYGSVIAAFLYTIGFCIITRTEWQALQAFRAFVGHEPQFCTLMHICSVLLALYYLITLRTHWPHSVIDEQFWVAFLVCAGFVGNNPFIWHEDAAKFSARLVAAQSIPYWLFVVNDTVYTAAAYFYLVACAHSYRLLGETYIHTWWFYAPKLIILGTYIFVKLFASGLTGVIPGDAPLSRLISFVILAQSGRIDSPVFLAVLIILLMDTLILAWIAREVIETRRVLANVGYVENRTKQLGFRIYMYKNLVFAAVVYILSALLTIGLPREYFYVMYDQNHTVQLSPIVGNFGLGLVYFTWVAITTFMYLPVSLSATEAVSSAIRHIASCRLYERHVQDDTEQPRSSRLCLSSDVFVLETAIQMFNLSWLAYLPGNRMQFAKEQDEEVAPLQSPGRRTSSRRSVAKESGTTSRRRSSQILTTTASGFAQHHVEESALPEDVLLDRKIPRLFREVFPGQREGYHFVRHLVHSPTDCHVVVVEQYDRVVVAFSGSRGVRNWIHNLAFYRVEWNREFVHFPSCSKCANIDPDNLDPLLNITDSCSCKAQQQRDTSPLPHNVLRVLTHELSTFGKMKVHAGFARMYAAIRSELLYLLKDLYSSHSRYSYFYRAPDASGYANRMRAARRPLLLTGHSLGGALATLCGFDVATHLTSIGIPAASDIAVTTFGCPKVGNPAFCNAYNSVIKSHWRVIVASDFFAKLPRYNNYKHVGSEVMLDFHGRLLIDPSLVEQMWMHILPLSTALHSRACYLLAFQALCMSPEFLRPFDQDVDGVPDASADANAVLRSPPSAAALDMKHADAEPRTQEPPKPKRLLDLLWPWPVAQKFQRRVIRTFHHQQQP